MTPSTVRSRLLIAAALALPTLAHAADPDGWVPRPYDERLAHAPRPLPDRIVLTWAGDPATTQAVTWRTDTSVPRARAEIDVAAENGRDLKPREVPAQTETLVSDLGEAHYHSVRFTDLQPDTLYAYRVGDGANWSEWLHFQTASREPRPFTFVYFGDAQVDIKAHWSRVFREAFRDAPRAAFTLHAGDLVNHANRDAEWGEWLGAPGWVDGTIPVIATPGNHEYESEGTGPASERRRVLSRHWRPQFAFPEQGAPEGLEETCYSIDYQGARIISLDSNRGQAEQVAWLRTVLKTNPQRWTILTFHHPIFSPARERDNPELRAAWKPVFDEFKVDLVLTGHDHSYARTGDVRGRGGSLNAPAGYNQAYDPAIGTVYVVSVSGPKMYGVTHDFAARTAEDTQLYQVVRVGLETLEYEARTATGRLYDAFTLRKRPGRPNELVEASQQLPPERRRPPVVAPAISSRP
jgi:3',5'-cyclic AMP phosphodiesterase CpdA